MRFQDGLPAGKLFFLLARPLFFLLALLFSPLHGFDLFPSLRFLGLLPSLQRKEHNFLLLALHFIHGSLICRNIDHNLCLTIRFTAVPIAAVVVTAVVAIVVVHYDTILQHMTPITATIHHLMHHHRGLLGWGCR
uniref:Putative secreted peptide n=1 Tax=Anopheles braziliensis TaxID=58242 RepID=A0A2M3ZQ81_9DIPT